MYGSWVPVVSPPRPGSGHPAAHGQSMVLLGGTLTHCQTDHTQCCVLVVTITLVKHKT